MLFISTSDVAFYFVRAFRVTACSTGLPSPTPFNLRWVGSALLS